jgi:hypothetical protein
VSDLASGAPPGDARASPLAGPRLVALAVCLATWVLPWEVAFVDYAGPARTLAGPVRTGGVAALAFVAAWGLALAAGSRRGLPGLAVGEAATSFALGALVVGLLVAEHPFLPGGDRRESWIPVFAPLACLAALDLGVRLSRPGAGAEITAVRAGSAAVAALALFVAREPLPLGAAAWLALAAGSSLLSADTARRRGQHALALVAAVAILYAPEALAWIEPQPSRIRTASPAPLAYRAAAAALVAATFVDFVRPHASDRR